jgi:hypothetical protein
MLAFILSLGWILGTIYFFRRFGWANWRPWVFMFFIAFAINPFVTDTYGGNRSNVPVETCQQYAGSWRGSGNYGMGLANVILQLDSDCEATLIIDHVDYRLSGTEYGRIVDGDYGKIFKATNGGKYNVYFRSNYISVTGSDFNFTLY